ncbi:MAG: stage III sporulation protein AF [Bacillota bacterium]
MIDVLSILGRNLVLIIFINVLLEMLLPQGQFHRYIRLVTGLLVILLVVGTMNMLLGKAPAYSEASPAAWAPEAEATAYREELLRNTSRQQVLTLFQASLEEIVRQEVTASGRWHLRAIQLTVEDNPENENFGALYRVEITVQRSLEQNAGAVATVRIDPVDLSAAESEAAPTGGEEPAAAASRVIELEQSLAARLQLAPGLVCVTAVD